MFFDSVKVKVLEPSTPASVHAYFLALHLLNKKAHIYGVVYIASDEMISELTKLTLTKEILNGQS